MSILDAALDYRHRGWSIIPVQNKVAVGSWKKFQKAPPDPCTIPSLFSQ